MFEGGPALKELTMDILGQLYREVGYAETISAAGDCDLAVEASLRSYEIYMNFRQGNTVRLGIDYKIVDSEGNVVEELSTNTSSEEPYSGGERATAYLVGAFYNIGKMKEKVGAAWDTATVNSIGELLDTLLTMEEP